MKVEINIDETRFHDVLEKELEAFNKEEIHDILRECIKDFFSNNEEVKKLFLEEHNRTNWSTGERTFDHYEPTGLFRDIVRNNFDYKEPFEEAKASIIKLFSKEDAAKNLLKEMMFNAFAEAFSSYIWRDSEFRNNVIGAVKNDLERR